MILFNVILKPTDHVFELKFLGKGENQYLVPIQIANEAFVFFVRVLGSLVVSQLYRKIISPEKRVKIYLRMYQ